MMLKKFWKRWVARHLNQVAILVNCISQVRPLAGESASILKGSRKSYDLHS
jgi:hypothetical protein